jgi:ADP-dependent NAD(P)H-hydrate dehydratase / NAD(P)H-hydrate epimerase
MPDRGSALGPLRDAMTMETALLDCGQMAEADRLAVAAGTSVIELMDAAGRAVAGEILSRWQTRPTVVVCGPGNNGGDGFVVGKVLADAGWPVRLALLGSIERLPEAARHHASLWRGPVEPLSPAVVEGAGLVVDAIFGAGLNRPLAPAVRETLAAAAGLRDAPLVAVDVPSGVSGDTGETFGAVAATLTVTFFRKKPGHVLLPGRRFCGETVVTDIGIPPSVLTQIAPNTFENDPRLWLSELPSPEADSHKYTRGHALILGGYPMTGAARLAARGAQRAGAGLTTIAVPPVAFPIYATALTSVMVHALAGEGDLPRLLSDQRFKAVLIGPGAGANEATRAQVFALLGSSRPVVMDAGALTAFGDDPGALMKAIEANVSRPCVLTPHDGEFARLFDGVGDKLSRSRTAVRISNAIVVLKGSDTVIAAPSGEAIINSNAPATLATAGSGDVLAGMIVGFLAQGMAPLNATAAAVWMHGAAACEFGPGLIADDLPEMLPAVLRKLHDLKRSPSHGGT